MDVKTLPHGDFALEFGRRIARRVLHSYGAIESLEKLLAVVADDGFILVNDYGQTQTTRDDEFEHQRFSLATFVGVNFPLLKAFFGEQRKCQWLRITIKPGGCTGMQSFLDLDMDGPRNGDAALRVTIRWTRKSLNFTVSRSIQRPT